MDSEVDREIRKIRKKLRQIERLREKAEDLTPDEYQKIQARGELRAKLQSLLSSCPQAAQRAASHTLQATGSASSAAAATATTLATPFRSSAQVADHSADDGAALTAVLADDCSYSDLDSSAADLDSSAASFNCSSVLTSDVQESTRDCTESTDEHAGSATATATATATALTPPELHHSAGNQDSVSATQAPSHAASATQATGDAASATHKQATKKLSRPAKTTASANAEAAQGGKEQKHKSSEERFREALRTARLGWEASRLQVTELGDVNDRGDMGLTCVDCRDDVVVTGGRDTTVRVWSVSTSSEVHSLTGHKDTVTCVCLLPANSPVPEDTGVATAVGPTDSDRHAVTGSRDCTVRVWNITSGRQQRSLYTYAPVLSMSWTRTVLATGADSGRVQLWSWPDLAELCSLRVHEDAITCVQLHGRLLVTGDAPGVIKLWQMSADMRTAQPLQSTVSSVRGSPLKPQPTKQGQQERRTASTLSPPSSSTTSYRPIQCMAMPSKQYLAWGDDGANLKMFHLPSGNVAKFPNHLGSFGRTDCLAVSDDGELLLSSAFDLDTGEAYVNIRSASTMQYLATLHATDPDALCLGHVRSIACTRVPTTTASTAASSTTASSAGTGAESRHRWCVVGDNFTVFDVIPPATSSSDKTSKKKGAKKTVADKEESDFRFIFVPALAGRAADSDVESSSDDDDDDHSANAAAQAPSSEDFEADTEDDATMMSTTAAGPRRRRRKRRDGQQAAALLQQQAPQGWWFMRWCTIL
eukprot:scpid30712/ scgid0999/ F-box/WD repeat-containing protein 7; F-box and WD-40 domain-containing protein 7; Protein archipelago